MNNLPSASLVLQRIHRRAHEKSGQRRSPDPSHTWFWWRAMLMLMVLTSVRLFTVFVLGLICEMGISPRLRLG